jgi:hypothetical protein
MRKIILTTIVLFVFSLSIIMFQLSCKKDAQAQTSGYILLPATTSKLGGVIPDGSTISVDAAGKISAINTSVAQQNKIMYLLYEGDTPGTNTAIYGVYTANYDGTDAQKVNITLPSGVVLNDGTLSLSPDHKTIFFSTNTVSTNELDIYACNFDGSNPHKVISNGENVVPF